MTDKAIVTETLSPSLEEYFARQIGWSRETFGPALRTGGVIDHIRKELKEIELDPHDLSEWVDVVILAMDGFWRHGGSADAILPALLAKQKKNMARTWPDWRTMSEDSAIEHDRSKDALSASLALERGEAEPVAVATNIKRYDEHPDGGGMREDELGAYVKFEAVHQLEVRIAKLVDVLRNFTASRDISYVEALKLARVALGDYRSHSTLSKRGEAEETRADQSCGCDGAWDPDGCENCTPSPSTHMELSDRIMRILEDHDRSPPQARDYSRKRGTAILIMQAIRQADAAPQTNVVGNDASKAAFNHGYLLACCNIVNLHDEPSIAFDVLRELGVSKTEVKVMELCDYDAKALRKIERARGNSSVYGKAKSPPPVSRAAVSTPSPEGRL